MSERINIWGNPGCELPNGKLCNVCCVLPDVELEGKLVSVGKPPFSFCPYLDEKGSGCTRHLKNKPETCVSWHCNSIGTNYRRELISGALALNIITSEEAKQAVLLMVGENKDLSFVETELTDIKSEAKRLTGMITHRDLIEGDLVEI